MYYQSTPTSQKFTRINFFVEDQQWTGEFNADQQTIAFKYADQDWQEIDLSKDKLTFEQFRDRCDEIFMQLVGDIMIKYPRQLPHIECEKVELSSPNWADTNRVMH